MALGNYQCVLTATSSCNNPSPLTLNLSLYKPPQATSFPGLRSTLLHLRAYFVTLFRTLPACNCLSSIKKALLHTKYTPSPPIHHVHTNPPQYRPGVHPAFQYAPSALPQVHTRYMPSPSVHIRCTLSPPQFKSGA